MNSATHPHESPASNGHQGPVFRLKQDQPGLICQIPPADPEAPGYLDSTPAGSYGIGTTLRRYAQLPEDFPVQVSVEHTIPYDAERMLPWEIGTGFPTIFTVNPARAERYLKAGMKRAEVIGMPMLYAIRLHERKYGKLPGPSERRGTIVFPHKSEAVMRDRIFDHGPMVRWLKALPEEYHPIHVCVYWKDYLKGDAVPFEEAGYPVLSCGHWLDDDFLPRFVDMCSQFRYSAGNSFASSFPLSVMCGCQYMYVNTGGHVETPKGGATVVHSSDPTSETAYGKAAVPITPFPPVAGDYAKQLKLAREMTGHDHVRYAWTMRRLLRRESRELDGQRGCGLDFTGEPVSWEKLRPWQVQDISMDGWLHRQVSLWVPVRHEKETLVMHLEVPQWSGLTSQSLKVIVPHLRPFEMEVKKGNHVLRVALPSPGVAKNVRVRLVFGEVFSLTGEERQASARLLHFKVEEASQNVGKGDITIKKAATAQASLANKRV